MNTSGLLNKLGRYGAIGVLAAAVHAGVLLFLGHWIAFSSVITMGFCAWRLWGVAPQSHRTLATPCRTGR